MGQDQSVRPIPNRALSIRVPSDYKSQRGKKVIPDAANVADAAPATSGRHTKSTAAQRGWGNALQEAEQAQGADMYLLQVCKAGSLLLHQGAHAALRHIRIHEVALESNLQTLA